MAGILILGELADGHLDPITGEMLSAGRSLGGDLAVALLGADLGAASSEAISLGADRVYEVRHPVLAKPSADGWVSALEQVCRQVAPSVVLVGRTLLGRDVGPRVAYRLGVGVAQDCVGLRTDPATNRVVAIRPVYGGNALARVTFGADDPQVVIVRSKVFDPIDTDPSRAGEITQVSVDLDDATVRVRHVETVRRETKGVRLEDARVVVSGGRGLGGPEPFELLRELAGLLGGAVGASRAVCDAGWVDHNLQIGLTGTTVTPELYIAIGISGASQHMAGCSGAKHIVAVNKDPDANIFREASYGIVGDWRNVLPAFLEAVRELRQG